MDYIHFRRHGLLYKISPLLLENNPNLVIFVLELYKLEEVLGHTSSFPIVPG